ncbi:SPASM domain-containing protein [Cytophagaceae bacterium ABcell3]|nr:SPASM domain-containing protein [Cytophagaceae bacterium ABcell3]
MYTNISDYINLLSKLTPRRIANALKATVGFYYSRVTSRTHHPALPISISIEPTTSCNLRCPECPSGLRSFSRPTGMLTEHVFDKVIEELHPTLLYLTFYFQGEPYLNPGFLKMVEKASSKKIYTTTSTNAHYLNDENAKKTVASGLDRLIISIDGATQETYQSYRVGGKLSKVIEGTKNIIKWKKKLKTKKPYIVFQFLVVKPNEHEIEDLKKMAKELGVDKAAFKTAQIYDYKNGSPLIPEQEQYSRYKQLPNGTYTIKNKLLNHCWKMWESCVITWDGAVVPCCFDKDAHHTMGSVQEKTFQEIWNSTPYHKFRKSLFQSRSQIEICRNCTEGTKIWG